ncbi:thioredoxin family protein [Salipaludibacillus keqinensis]|uniref:Thioredoxin family protein n=1 Tax=Salipaludibacillus keqinensis TaxID=2045207 RepID=A0A323TG69_9BACI|nr:glutaredoxin family protein [Salipaludibacillus keqinensis]PYZ92864.1 thioredoxin family protein [Salipaludibacillus keqinensis]
MVLYFYTKDHCPLCEKGLVELQRLQREHDFQIEHRDIYTNDDWLEKYQIRIPVVSDEKDRVLDEGILSYEKLKQNYSKLG